MIQLAVFQCIAVAVKYAAETRNKTAGSAFKVNIIHQHIIPRRIDGRKVVFACKYRISVMIAYCNERHGIIQTAEVNAEFGGSAFPHIERTALRNDLSVRHCKY